MNSEEKLSAVVFVGESPIHGKGLFAAAKIFRGSLVIEYIGEKIGKAESLRRCQAGNEYIFGLSDEIDLDGNIEANLARFINHSCSPNCHAEFIGGEIWIVADHDIEPGEEITFNYSYDFEDFREHPCRCRSADCVGYIVAEVLIPQTRHGLSSQPGS
jgi:uncharacterized protein